MTTAADYLQQDLLRNVREFVEYVPCGCIQRSNPSTNIEQTLCWHCLLQIRLQEYDQLVDAERSAQHEENHGQKERQDNQKTA